VTTVLILIHLFLGDFGVPMGHLGIACGTYPPPYIEVCIQVPVPIHKPPVPVDN
jgi:hypothetical protein